MIAPDKQSFDQLIMSSIQSKWAVVKSTRTFLLIDSMSWHRQDLDRSPIFISVAEGDLHRALWLGERIETDVGLTCWTYNNIPIGAASWTEVIDETINAAPLTIFLLSHDSLKSEECQREYGRADAISNADDICCVLFPIARSVIFPFATNRGSVS